MYQNMKLDFRAKGMLLGQDQDQDQNKIVIIKQIKDMAMEDKEVIIALPGHAIVTIRKIIKEKEVALEVLHLLTPKTNREEMEVYQNYYNKKKLEKQISNLTYILKEETRFYLMTICTVKIKAIII